MYAIDWPSLPGAPQSLLPLIIAQPKAALSTARLAGGHIEHKAQKVRNKEVRISTELSEAMAKIAPMIQNYVNGCPSQDATSVRHAYDLMLLLKRN